jgi:hypothetical protein
VSAAAAAVARQFADTNCSNLHKQNMHTGAQTVPAAVMIFNSLLSAVCCIG